jgi:hypothetical protein
MKTPAFDLKGKNVSKRFLVLEAQEYLPQHLRNQICVNDKEVRNVFKEPLIIAFFATPLLSMFCALAAPFVIRTIIDFTAPPFLYDTLTIINSSNFERAFGLTVFPIIFLMVLWGSTQRSLKKRFERENENLTLEIAFQKGHDQSLIRDSAGHIKNLI